MRARFLTEARITAALQHPGIVAVHDQGELADGRLWFTMKEVRGRTLREVIDEVHGASRADGFFEAPSGWTFRRLLDAFARISQAVAFAHSRGVMHRDLKPDNVMVGEFGEVLVMDWGLARRVDADLDDSLAGLVSIICRRRAPHGPADPVSALASPWGTPIRTSPRCPRSMTRQGDVLGTPAYMPPEQALGQREQHGPHSDVYALGAILYHVLSGRPPYSGTSRGVLRQVIAGPPPPLADVLHGRAGVPEELVAICERAMQREIRRRYPGAEPLSSEIVAFLEGARRREQALGVLDRARALEPEFAALRAREARLREQAKALLAEVQPFDPVEKKRGGWALEDEAAALGREAALRETEWLQTVHGALILHPELPEAHALPRRPLPRAPHRRRARPPRRGRGALRGPAPRPRPRPPRGLPSRRGRALAGHRPPGRARCASSASSSTTAGSCPWTTVCSARPRSAPCPSSAAATACGCARRGGPRCSIPCSSSAARTGTAALRASETPRPISFRSRGSWALTIATCPPGWCWTGGDPKRPTACRFGRMWIDAFVIRRFPVTNREYVAFLNALVADGREDEALAACPRSQLGMADELGERLVLGRDGAGRFVLTDDELGRRSEPDWPVVLVDWYGARAYRRLARGARPVARGGCPTSWSARRQPAASTPGSSPGGIISTPPSRARSTASKRRRSGRASRATRSTRAPTGCAGSPAIRATGATTSGGCRGPRCGAASS